MNYWFTSDTHFGHRRIIKYCGRPWIDESITDMEDMKRYKLEEMDDALAKKWNARVKEGDYVYHLGDFCFGDAANWRNYRRRLNGKIFLILGNHDNENHAREIMDVVQEYAEVNVNHQKIILFHYGMRTWRHDLKGHWHLYGHSHGQLPAYGKSFDVGVDCQNFEPISFDEVRSGMAKREIGPHPMFNEYTAEPKWV